jgi:hypothetical protein
MSQTRAVLDATDWTVTTKLQLLVRFVESNPAVDEEVSAYLSAVRADEEASDDAEE